MPWHLARGYRFNGVHCGVRPEGQRLDLALMVSEVPASAAGVFTRNRVCAAPVLVSRQRVPGTARGIVACSGNANACTGEQGLADARHMAALAAEAVGCAPEQMLVCSTGIIGRPLPMSRIESGIHELSGALGKDEAAWKSTAQAILTTDTRIKVATRSVQIGGRDVRFSGLAKGAAMIGPNMATMLAFVLTDAPVAPRPLQDVLGRAVQHTFNCISVEGHTSTNDTLLAFANGAAGGEPLQGGALEHYAHSLTEVCGELARAIADDAEGSSHLITIDVEGLRSDAEARQVAKTVAESALVKTAVFGADPNWGRIVSAAGYAGVEFMEADLSLWLGEHLLYEKGTPRPFNAATVSGYLKENREVTMRLHFNLGPGRCRFYTCDLGHEYIRLNAEYTT